MLAVTGCLSQRRFCRYVGVHDGTRVGTSVLLGLGVYEQRVRQRCAFIPRQVIQRVLEVL